VRGGVYVLNNGAPNISGLPRARPFAGQAIHSAEYRNSVGYAGRRVVVVGGGNSAVQIAAELAHVARVSIATRSPLKLIEQRPLGRDVRWWLTRTGLDTGPVGAGSSAATPLFSTMAAVTSRHTRELTHEERRSLEMSRGDPRPVPRRAPASSRDGEARRRAP